MLITLKSLLNTNTSPPLTCKKITFVILKHIAAVITELVLEYVLYYAFNK